MSTGGSHARTSSHWDPSSVANLTVKNPKIWQKSLGGVSPASIVARQYCVTVIFFALCRHQRCQFIRLGLDAPVNQTSLWCPSTPCRARHIRNSALVVFCSSDIAASRVVLFFLLFIELMNPNLTMLIPCPNLCLLSTGPSCARVLRPSCRRSLPQLPGS